MEDSRDFLETTEAPRLRGYLGRLACWLAGNNRYEQLVPKDVRTLGEAARIPKPFGYHGQLSD